MAGFAVRHPNGQIVHPYQWRPNADYQDEASTGGYYSVCIDNQFSRFAAKLVNLYLTVIRYINFYYTEILSTETSLQNLKHGMNGNVSYLKQQPNFETLYE